MPVKKHNKEPSGKRQVKKGPDALPKKLGAPFVYNALELAERLQTYTDSTDDPMVEEFCLVKGNPTRDTLYRLEKDCKELSDTIKRLHSKQQVRTVKKAEAGEMNPTFAIFKLKQKCYGWTDKQEVEHSGEIKMPTILIGK